jgi:hypothetical protein
MRNAFSPFVRFQANREWQSTVVSARDIWELVRIRRDLKYSRIIGFSEDKADHHNAKIRLIPLRMKFFGDVCRVEEKG